MDYPKDITIGLPHSVYQANAGDWRLIADITAEAFADDPVNTWLFGNPRAIKSAFRVLMRDIYSKRGICHLIDEKAAAVWVDYRCRPNLHFGRLTQLNFMIGLWRHGSKGALERAIEAGNIMENHHPKLPHLYLFTIGTRRLARGKGLGRTLLRPMLDCADKANLPCYLENSNPINTGFYNAHGFHIIEKFPCGEGGPLLESMWREPQ